MWTRDTRTVAREDVGGKIFEFKKIYISKKLELLRFGGCVVRSAVRGVTLRSFQGGGLRRALLVCLLKVLPHPRQSLVQVLKPAVQLAEGGGGNVKVRVRPIRCEVVVVVDALSGLPLLLGRGVQNGRCVSVSGRGEWKKAGGGGSNK
jgi:hypothetical protein